MGTQDLPGENSYQPEGSKKVAEIPDYEKEAADFIENYRKDRKLEFSPNYFIKKEFLDELCGIPSFQGINIYIGKNKDGDEILFLVGTTKIGKQIHNVFNYEFSINNDKFIQPKSQPAPMLRVAAARPPQPCPPYPPGSRSCP